MPMSSCTLPSAAHLRLSSPSLPTISTAAAIACSAWSTSSTGAPNSAITMSPTNLSTVPWSEDHFDHAREVLVQLPDELLGLALLGDRGEAADVGEQDRHLAAAAAELRQLGVRDQLLVDVPRHVSAEQPLDDPLLGVLDEVVIGGAGEEREAHREERLRHGQPQPAVERHERRAGPSRDERGGQRRRRRTAARPTSDRRPARRSRQRRPSSSRAPAGGSGSTGCCRRRSRAAGCRASSPSRTASETRRPGPRRR